MKIIHTLPLLIHKDPLEYQHNMKMAARCFESLGLSED